MDEARRVLERLERIETLDRARTPPAELLAEVRGLLADAEAWVRVEGRPGSAEAALDDVRDALRGESATRN